MFFAVLPCFCSFVDVICVAHLLCEVAGFTAHPWSLSFEWEDGRHFCPPYRPVGWGQEVGGEERVRRVKRQSALGYCRSQIWKLLLCLVIVFIVYIS